MKTREFKAIRRNGYTIVEGENFREVIVGDTKLYVFCLLFNDYGEVACWPVVLCEDQFHLDWQEVQ